jgi:hypothetical protein
MPLTLTSPQCGVTVNDRPLNSPELLDILLQAPVQERESIELALLSFWHSLIGDSTEQTARIIAYAQKLVSKAQVNDLQTKWNIHNPVSYDAYSHGADHFGSMTMDGVFTNEFQARPTAVPDYDGPELMREASSRPCDRPSYGSLPPQWLGRPKPKVLVIANKKSRLRTKRLLCERHGVQVVTSNGGRFRLACGCHRTRSIVHQK